MLMSVFPGVLSATRASLPVRLLHLYVVLQLCTGCAVSADNAPTYVTTGWLEQIMVSPPGIVLHAKLDTGADNCSIHAGDIDFYTKGVGEDKEKWVKFSVENRYGEARTITRKIIRTAKIKMKVGGFQRRPVVRLDICLGSYFESVECNLVDRSHFAYPVLIGRNYLAGNILVNSADTYVTKPLCAKP